MQTRFSQKKWYSLFLILLLTFASCEHHETVVNGLDEQEANEIVVYLASKGIPCQKQGQSSAGTGGATLMTYRILVDSHQTTDAMAILGRSGLPRKKGVDLLTLFEKQGLMSTDKEEEIRYRAGLAEEIATTIRMFDGVLDARVQIAFPPQETSLTVQEGPKGKVTASVYVKHQGILDDPNSHLMPKIKRIVAASVPSLDVNDVTVIADKARFSDISLNDVSHALNSTTRDYMSIWSIVISNDSAGKFRLLMTFLLFLIVVFALMTAWLIWKFYPLLQQRGFKSLIDVAPYKETKTAEKKS